MTFQGYLQEGTFIYIKARCQPRPWKQDQLELKVTSIDLLPDVKEKLIERITILVPLGLLDKGLVDELAEMTRQHPGSTELCFKVTDPDSLVSVGPRFTQRQALGGTCVHQLPAGTSRP